MCNQFVLKGGSFGTPINHIRSTYRNFYYPHDRWQFVWIKISRGYCFMKNLNYIDHLNINRKKLVNYEKRTLHGLTDLNQKRLNPKYFYDEKGSILFERITNTKDYYPTKTELGILDKKNEKIKKELPQNSSIIEFGSGSNKKIKRLLKIIDKPSEYISIDISKDFLIKNSKQLAKEFPNLKITAITADFNHKFDIPIIKILINQKLVFFLVQLLETFLEIRLGKL